MISQEYRRKCNPFSLHLSHPREPPLNKVIILFDSSYYLVHKSLIMTSADFEKNADAIHLEDSPHDGGTNEESDPTIRLTPKEQARITRRIDLRVTTVLGLLYLIGQAD